MATYTPAWQNVVDALADVDKLIEEWLQENPSDRRGIQWLRRIRLHLARDAHREWFAAGNKEYFQ